MALRFDDAEARSRRDITPVVDERSPSGVCLERSAPVSCCGDKSATGPLGKKKYFDDARHDDPAMSHRGEVPKSSRSGEICARKCPVTS